MVCIKGLGKYQPALLGAAIHNSLELGQLGLVHVLLLSSIGLCTWAKLVEYAMRVIQHRDLLWYTSL